MQNVFKATVDRCHFFHNPIANVTFNIIEYAIESSHSEKLLGITIDSNLIFEEHLKKIYCKSNLKFFVPSRVVSY